MRTGSKPTKKSAPAAKPVRVKAVMPGAKRMAPAKQPGETKSRGLGRVNAPGQIKKRTGVSVKAQKAGGIDIGKFASEVSSNFGKGVSQVAKSLDRAPGVGASRGASRGIPSSAQSKKNNAAIKKALGRN